MTAVCAGQPAVVCRSDVIGAVVLQMSQEAEDLLEAQVLDVELGDLCSLLVGHEAQQQPDGTAVAAH